MLYSEKYLDKFLLTAEFLPHIGCYGAEPRRFSSPRGDMGLCWKAALPFSSQRLTQALLLPAWEQAASVEMNFSWNVSVLKGFGTQKKGQRHRLWSLVLQESLWRPLSTSAAVLIFIFFNFFFSPSASSLADREIKVHIHSSWHFAW